MTLPKVNGEILDKDEVNNEAGQVIPIEAGENITAGNVIYIHLTDGKAYVSDTGTADDIRAKGIALNTATSGNDVNVLTSGIYTTTGLTDKADYYLGTAGAISTTLSGVRIGTALSTTELYVQIIQDDRDAVGTVKMYSLSISGIPSNNLNAFWVVCAGATISDSESPLDGQPVPSYNSENRFPRGNTTSGTESGSTTTSGPSATTEDLTDSGSDLDPAHTHQVTVIAEDTVFIIKIK